MDFFNKGSLNNTLEQVGIDDVGSFVNQFRNQARREAPSSEDESEGSQAMNEFSGGQGGNNRMNMIQGAINAYKKFSGGHGTGTHAAGSGGFFNNIGSGFENAQQMYTMYKQFDKNGDGKITADDIEIFLQQAGLGGVSPFLAKGIFQAVDQNHNGSLDFTDLMALTAIINRVVSQHGGGGGGAVVPQ